MFDFCSSAFPLFRDLSISASDDRAPQAYDNSRERVIKFNSNCLYRYIFLDEHLGSRAAPEIIHILWA